MTKDVYWPAIRRGPETADIEMLQWDGLHDRWDEQPSGFAPYELARLAKDTGGIYFLLPSEENMRVRQREKLYSITTLKEYVPDYESRIAYVERRTKSEFRRTLYDIIQATRSFPFRHHFPVMPDADDPGRQRGDRGRPPSGSTSCWPSRSGSRRSRSSATASPTSAGRRTTT